MTTQHSPAENSLQTLCEQHQAALTSQATPWWAPLSAKAMQQFSRDGLPSTRSEHWRYTSFNPLRQHNIVWTEHDNAEATNAASQTGSHYANLTDAHHVPLCHGIPLDLQASSAALPTGVELQSLQNALHQKQHQATLEPLLYKCAPQEPFVALNTALLRDGLWLQIAPNCTIEQPIHFDSIVQEYTQANTNIRSSHPRMVIVVGRNSHVSLLETFTALRSYPQLNNIMVHVILEKDAQLDYVKIQDGCSQSIHLTKVDVTQHSGSHFTSQLFSLGAQLVRHDIDVNLQGEGATCTLEALACVNGQQHISLPTTVRHQAAHTSSQQLYKVVADEQSSSTFHGRVIVAQHAPKTQAHQSNKNLLLSSQATAHTRPQLEIETDDVQCTHGATVGRLDANQLHYLCTRGLDLATARHELTCAFAAELVTHLKNDVLGQHLQQQIRKKLSPLTQASQP